MYEAQYQAEMASKMTTPITIALRLSGADSRNEPRAAARAHINRFGQRNGNWRKTKNPNMPAKGTYNRKTLNQSLLLLALNQVAPKKSTIAPPVYRRRRSSETAKATPNTRPLTSRPRPSEPNLNFHLLPFADIK